MKHAFSLGVIFIILTFTANALLSADRVEIFPLKHRAANEIIPIIKPLLGKDAAITGQGFNLIVRAPTASLEQVRDIIAQLDRAAKRLRVSVRSQQAEAPSRQDIGASGTIHSGDAEIQLNDSDPARLKLHESVGRSAKNGTQTVHTLEGRQAFIQVGQLVPVPERNIDRFGNQREIMHYKNATTGFYVVARLSDGQVILDISPHSISVDQHGRQRFNIEQASTSLRGNIGEWMALGAISQTRSQSNKQILSSSEQDRLHNSQLQIKVEIIPE